MDFIINNYIIFIIIGVILLMALIGYIADNTNFEKKPKKEKKSKKDKKKQKEDVVTELESADVVPSISEENPLDMPSDLDAPTETEGKEIADASNDGLMDAFETPNDFTSQDVEPAEAESTPDSAAPIVEENIAVNPVSPEETSSVVETEASEATNEEKKQVEKTTTEENTDDIWKF